MSELVRGILYEESTAGGEFPAISRAVPAVLGSFDFAKKSAARMFSLRSG
jgi:hypothetical protein